MPSGNSLLLLNKGHTFLQSFLFPSHPRGRGSDSEQKPRRGISFFLEISTCQGPPYMDHEGSERAGEAGQRGQAGGGRSPAGSSEPHASSPSPCLPGGPFCATEVSGLKSVPLEKVGALEPGSSSSCRPHWRNAHTHPQGGTAHAAKTR